MHEHQEMLFAGIRRHGLPWRKYLKQSCRLAPAPQSMKMRLRRLVIEAACSEETRTGGAVGNQIGVGAL